MYMVYYQKKNGIVFNRVRNSLPQTDDDNTTSMGWKVLDIQYNYKGKYYPFIEYKTKSNKLSKRVKNLRALRKFIKKFSFVIIYLVSLPLYDYIKTII